MKSSKTKLFERALMTCLASVTVACTMPPPTRDFSSIDSYREGFRLVVQAMEAHGGVDELRLAGGVTVSSKGTFDLTVRLQGRSPFRSEPTDIRERIAIDLAVDRIAHDLDWSNYRFSRQSLREVHDARGRVLYVDRRAGTAGWSQQPADADARTRFRRILPRLLLADALDHRATLRYAGRSTLDGRPVEPVGYVTSAGDHMTLFFELDSGLLVAASHLFDMELLGDTEVRWVWSNYRDVGGGKFPGRLRTYLAGDLLKDVHLDVETGVEPAAFGPPPGIDAGEPPEPAESAPSEDFVPYSRRPGQVRELAPRVYLVPNIRPGFHMFFVEFDDHLVAIDAPTGWYEFHQIPPYNFVRGEGTSALGEKYIRTITTAVPDKPIGSVVLTHHHSDHIGGVREFIARGIPVMAAAPAAALARRSARQDFTLHPDSLSDRAVEPDIEIVEGHRTLADGRMEVQLIRLPDDNPKADGFLAVYLPRHRIMYLTSFLYPVPEEAFPVPESVPLSLWFVRWLDQSGLEVDRIYNVHAQARVQDWQLERFREMLRDGSYPIAGEQESQIE